MSDGFVRRHVTSLTSSTTAHAHTQRQHEVDEHVDGLVRRRERADAAAQLLERELLTRERLHLQRHKLQHGGREDLR